MRCGWVSIRLISALTISGWATGRCGLGRPVGRAILLAASLAETQQRQNRSTGWIGSVKCEVSGQASTGRSAPSSPRGSIASDRTAKATGHRACSVAAPPMPSERALADAASAQMIDHASDSESALLWPRASAARSAAACADWLAVLVTATIVIAMLARCDHLDRVLIPIVAAVLMAPGMRRLAAGDPAHPQPDRGVRSPDERALPMYSVLMPLRDEAHMVALLRRGDDAARLSGASARRHVRGRGEEPADRASRLSRSSPIRAFG